MTASFAPSPPSPGPSLGAGNPTPLMGAQATPDASSPASNPSFTSAPRPTVPGAFVPEAAKLETLGRGEDKMLVHMTPGEVGGLQALAMAHGGSLTRNPVTGLPEAGFLSKILPTVLGGLLSFIPGLGPLAAAGIVGAGTGVVTGDLNKGLMAALGAFGGASLGGALGAGNVLGGGAANAASTAATQAGTQAATQAATQAGQGASLLSAGPNLTAASSVPGVIQSGFGIPAAQAAQAAQAGAQGGLGMLSAGPNLTAASSVPGVIQSGFGMPAAQAAQAGGLGALAPAAQAAQTGGGFLSRFGDAAAVGGVPRAVTTTAAGAGLFGGLSAALQPKIPKYKEEDDGFNYEGPYRPTRREYIRPGADRDPRDSSEHLYFTPTNPIPGYEPALPSDRRYAAGGLVDLRDGSFVVDARTVSEIGNGSSNAGAELLARYGGRPVHGPGDGVSDSVRASVDGRTPARVARDEVLLPPEAVRRMGGGSQKRGADKLYSLMERAHKARRKAGRGEDTGVRKGLA